MNNNTKVTIMIPTYNQPEYIRQAIDSALLQDYPNIEIVVSDDSTNDETKKILISYINDKKIYYYHNNPRLGRTKNYYHTLRNYATGDWVLNLDGDDFLINNSFISSSMKLVDQYKDIAMVFGKEKVYNEITDTYTHRTTNSNIPILLKGEELFLYKSAWRVNFFHLSTIYNRKKAIEVNFYADDYLGADTISLMKLLPGNKIAFLNKFGGAWRIHGNNDSFTEDNTVLVNNIDSLRVIYEYVHNTHLIKGEKLKRWLEHSIQIKYETYLINMLLNKKYQQAYKFSKEFKKKYKNYFILTMKKPRFYLKILISLFGKKIYTWLSNI